MSDAHPLDGLYEPESKRYPNATMVSIAISLKRIADALQGDKLTDQLGSAIAGGISHGADNWVSRMNRSGR